MPTSTVVAFHAHPDDEALLTAGTLARAARAGHRVILVLATRGDIGDVAEGMLESDEALGDRRAREAQASAEALGIERLVFLDYTDSGHAPDASGRWPRDSFCAAPVHEAAAALARILHDEHADLLLADDRNGGYGHPDHRQVHRVAWEAASAVHIPLLQSTIDREFLSGGIELARSMGLDVPEGFVPADLSSWYSSHDEITHTVDVSNELGARRASMAAHATQTTGAPDTVRTLSVFLGLPDNVFAIAFSTEWYTVATGDALPAAVPELFGDLFAPVTR
jgi:LmbE family N-acetylglucosaminyl deacetylase